MSLLVRAVFASTVALAAALSGVGPAVSMPAATSATGGLSIVVPIVAPAGSDALIPAAELTSYTAPDGVLTRELDSVTGRAVTLAIDPMLIASIRILGSDAPASAVAWLARLAALTNPSFALSYADSDLSAATQAGSPTPLAPSSFDFAIDPTRFAKAGATPAPGSSATTTAPVLPTSQNLLDWHYSIPSIAWPREDTVVSHDLAAFVVAGFTTTILGSGNVVQSGAGSGAASIGGTSVLISDDAVSVALRAAVDAASNDDWQAAVSRLVAAITAANASRVNGQPIIATLDRTAPTGGSKLSQTLDALAATTTITTAGLGVTSPAAGPQAQLAERPQESARIKQVASILGAEAQDAAFATVVPDPTAITAERRLQLLVTLSNAWAADPPGWTKEAEAYLKESTTLQSSVTVVASSTFNLLADRATLPIAVLNTLDQPVTVYITVDPDTALLAVTNSRVPITVEAHSQGNGQIPVQAISNGEVQVDISLESAAGNPIGGVTSSTINVQAGWETPIVVTIAGLVFVVFGLGIVRNVLGRRKRPTNAARDEARG
jgi:hypothetical protein